MGLNLNQIVEGDETLAHFMSSIQGHVEGLVEGRVPGIGDPGSAEGQPPATRKTPRKRTSGKVRRLPLLTLHSRKLQRSVTPNQRQAPRFFWGCSNYREGCRTLAKTVGETGEGSHQQKTARGD